MQQRQWCDGKQRSVVAVELGTLLHGVTDAMHSTDKRCGKLPSSYTIVICSLTSSQ